MVVASRIAMLAGLANYWNEEDSQRFRGEDNSEKRKEHSHVA